MDIDKMNFSNPERECDLVMKGGITSGIVYPRIVLKLASEGKYRFRNVGGTSAGAIAAAMMAAAEFGRETDGFQKFQELSHDLAKPGFLFNLFQPSPSLKPLMYTLLEVLGKIPPNVDLESSTPQTQSEQQESKQSSQPTKAKGGIQSVIRSGLKLVEILKRRHSSVAKLGSQRGLWLGLGVALLLTVIASIIFYGLAAYTDTDLNIWSAVLFFIVFGVPLGWFGSTVGILGFGALDLVEKITQEVPQDNFFGICTGRNANADQSVEDKSVLTDWLSSEIERIAGVQKPLTFGDLQNKKLGDEQKDVSISLKMVTSNLSQNQPYTLPFEEGHLFLFNKNDFIKLFPPNVVEHLKTYGEQQRKSLYEGKQRTFKLPPNSSYYFLPNPESMPIVVAMRMSLSFPLLFSAVPLYTIKQSAISKQSNSANNEYLLDDRHDLQKNWFSDGGISSNFPIHFFDSWLPSRPTFGINLTSVEEDALVQQNAQPNGDKRLNTDNLTVTPNTLSIVQNRNIQTSPEARKDVYLPHIGDLLAPEWVDLKESLPIFLWQIFSTSQNYRDTMQSYLPGYRERIVQVRLTDAEGGLNLAMDDKTINKVMQKGECAGELLCNQFDFKYHKWVRLRVLLGLLDDKLRETYDKALKDDKFQAQELIDEAQFNSFPFSYESIESAEKAKEAIERIKTSSENLWSKEPSLNNDKDTPRPKSALRTTPEF